MRREFAGPFAISLVAVTAITASAQTVDPIFGSGFEPGLVAFGPAFTAVADLSRRFFQNDLSE